MGIVRREFTFNGDLTVILRWRSVAPTEEYLPLSESSSKNLRREIFGKGGQEESGENK